MSAGATVLVAMGALLTALVIMLVVLRVRATRAEQGARLRVIGEQPEATTWLTPIVAEVAGEGADRWSYEVYRLSGRDGPAQTRVEMMHPSRQSAITISVDSSREAGTFTRSDPVHALVRVSASTPASGLLGLLAGQWFTPTHRKFRQLVKLIDAQSTPDPTPAAAPPPGAPVARSSSRKRTFVAIAIAAAVVITGVVWGVSSGLIGTLGGTTAGGTGGPSSGSAQSNSAAPPTPRPTAKSKVVVKGKKPKGAKACARVYELPGTPARSAVTAKTTSCEFGEEVRRAYIELGRLGKTVTLTDVYSPKTTKYYTMACHGAHTVTCTGGVKAKVYLY